MTFLGASLRAVFVCARKAPKYACPGCLHFVLLVALEIVCLRVGSDGATNGVNFFGNAVALLN